MWPFTSGEPSVGQEEFRDGNLSDAMNQALFENQSFGIAGLTTYVPTVLKNEAGEPYFDLPEQFDPMYAHKESSMDSGGIQPSAYITGGRILKDAAKPWYEFSIMPFKLAFHGLKIPLVGISSIVISKTEKAGVFIYSLIYMSLPTLKWFLGIDTAWFGKTHYRQWRQPPLFMDAVICDSCGCWRGLDDPTARSDIVTVAFRYCICQVSAIDPNLANMFKSGDNFDWACELSNYSSYADVLSAMGVQSTCVHDTSTDAEVGVAVPPRPSIDGLYMHKPNEIWKSNVRCGGARCVQCYETTVHGWHPDLVAKLGGPFPRPHMPAMTRLLQLIYRFNVFMAQFGANDVLHMLAVSKNRIKAVKLDDYPTIVLVDSMDTWIAIKPQTAQFKSRYYPFVVPCVGSNPRSYASMRVLLALRNASPCTLVLVNQVIDPASRPYVDTIPGSPYDIASGCVGHFHPAFAGAMKIKGRTSITSDRILLSSFYFLNTIYGWDELFPAYFEKCVPVALGGLARPAVMLGTTGPRVKGPEVAVWITDGVEWGTELYKFTWQRIAVYWVVRALGSDVDSGRLSFWHVFADTRPTFAVIPNPEGDPVAGSSNTGSVWYKEFEPNDPMPPPRRVVAAGDNIIQELAASIGGIRLFTLGTRGDRVPIQALAKHIARYKVPVYVQHLVTPEEGKLMLQSSLGEVEDDRVIPIYNRARTMAIELASSASLLPSNLHYSLLPSYTLAPPSDHIYAMTVAGGWINSIGNSILGLWDEPGARIGPYTGSRILPTSHDGYNFLRPRQNRGSHPIGAYWGSGERVPAGYEHIPVIPAGDHLEIMRDYRTVVCLGATAVSTAAAAGARVIVPEGGLDRSRRNPYDAGAGLVPGQDPDNIFLLLADQDIRFLAFWLRKNWLKPWKLFSWYGYPGIGWAAFRAVMLYTLYNSAYERVVPASDPWLVLAGVLSKRSFTLLEFIGLGIGARALDSLMEYLNISKMRVLSSFVDWNIKMSSSALAMWLASRYNIGWGLLYSALSPPIYKTLAAFGQAWSNVALGYFDTSFTGERIHAKVYFEMKITHWYGLPILHTALVCPDENERFDGQTVGGYYVYTIVKGGVESPFLLPTTLKWTDIKKLPRRSGIYSAAWNCHTALVISLKDMSVNLGVGGVVVSTTAYVVASIHTVTASMLAVVWALSTLLPDRIDPRSVKPSVMVIGADQLTALWNKLSATGYWDPVAVLDWWRSLYLAI